MRISDWSSDVCSSDLEATGTVTVTDRRAQAMADTGTWYQRLYGNDPELRQTRDNYAMKENTLPDPARRADLADFFFWPAWFAATARPASHASYTYNWPPEPPIANHHTPDNLIWSLSCLSHLKPQHGMIN